MPQISGVVIHGDGSPARGRRVGGLVGGAFGGMVGPTTTDSHGRFVLSWSSSTTTLSKVYVDGNVEREDVSAGDDISIEL